VPANTWTVVSLIPAVSITMVCAVEYDDIPEDGGDREPGTRIQAAFDKDFFEKPCLHFPGDYEKKN
jgi:hypothetical protein